MDGQDSLLAVRATPLVNRADGAEASHVMAQAVPNQPGVNTFLTDQGYGRQARRWIVERTFASLGRCRRISKDCEKTTRAAEAFSG